MREDLGRSRGRRAFYRADDHVYFKSDPWAESVHAHGHPPTVDLLLIGTALSTHAALW